MLARHRHLIGCVPSRTAREPRDDGPSRTVAIPDARRVAEPPTPIRIRMHVACSGELNVLQARAPGERAAIRQAIAVLEAHAGDIGHPWSSAVRGPDGTGLRELRPRAGRSRWRLIYRRDDQVIVLLALAPEAGRDRRGFARAVRAAAARGDLLRDEGPPHGA